MVEVRIDPDFGVEWGMDCEWDYLLFRDGSSPSSPAFKFSESARLCGYYAPEVTIQTTGPSMTVFFRSDISVTERGFRIYYKSVDTNSRAKRDAEKLVIGPEQNIDLPKKLYEQQELASRAKRRVSEATNVDRVFEPRHRNKRSTDDEIYTWIEYGLDDDEGCDYFDSFDFHFGSGCSSYNSVPYNDWFLDYFYDSFGNFDENMTAFNWTDAYQKSTSTDYSDFKPFVLFSREELEYFGTQAKDFIVQCSFDGRDCGHKDFQRSLFYPPLFLPQLGRTGKSILAYFVSLKEALLPGPQFLI